MKKRRLALFVLMSGALCILMTAPGGKTSDSGNANPPISIQPLPDLGNVPLYFIPNQGQVDPSVIYYAHASKFTLWITQKALHFDSGRKIKKNRCSRSAQSTRRRPTHRFERDISSFVFLNANPEVHLEAVEAAEHKVNYFRGDNPAAWLSGLGTSLAVCYRNLYKDIDLKIYGKEQRVEYDWVVKPGGRIEDIQWEFRDVKSIRLDTKRNLVIRTGFGETAHRRPVAYQTVAGERIPVKAEFQQKGDNTFGFKVGPYDRTHDLVIDPVVLVYSTYLGGSGWDKGHGVAVDASGAAYVAGETQSLDFPLKRPFDSTFGGHDDIVVVKFSPSGRNLVYSTYIGGSSQDEPEDIAVDTSGAVYITGLTQSEDFPTKDAMDSSYNGGYGDAFLTKISSSGRPLVYSTYLGGEELDWGTDVAVDTAGAAFVTGYTTSADFPTSHAFDGRLSGSSDAFVSKLDAFGKTFVYSTFLGGRGAEHAYGIAVDGYGAAYVTGNTSSDNFPRRNAFDTTLTGTGDVFVTKLDPSGTGLAYSTYLGGSESVFSEIGRSIAVDAFGSAYVTGFTSAPNFPVKKAFDPAFNASGDRDAFITKLAPRGNALVYSTYIGGLKDDWAEAIAVDSSGYAYVAGFTKSRGFPRRNAFDSTHEGIYEAFILKIASGGNSLVFSTFLGGRGWDDALGLAIDGEGCVYIVGQTNSEDYPTQNAFDNTFNAGIRDICLTKLRFE